MTELSKVIYEFEDGESMEITDPRLLKMLEFILRPVPIPTRDNVKIREDGSIKRLL